MTRRLQLPAVKQGLCLTATVVYLVAFVGVSHYVIQTVERSHGLSLLLVLQLVLGAVAMFLVALGLLTLITWWVLRPVERLRSEVAAINDGALHLRLAESGSGDDVDRLAASMNQLIQRLDRANQRQRQFVADASHELRSPLAAIRSGLEVAIAHPERVEWAALADGLLDETRRVQRLVDDLDLLSSAERGEVMPRHPALVDLDDVVLSQVKAEPWPSSLRVDASHVSAGLVAGDADQLARLVRNLLDNAVRHAVSRVEISLREVGDHVELAVVDDGRGIQAEATEHVFQRFARLDEGRARNQGGSGLGLAIVRELAQLHGGDVRVEDGGPGARFVVDLPRAAS